jgi:hypothetical protein
VVVDEGGGTDAIPKVRLGPQKKKQDYTKSIISRIE